jgi:hypothetical protein
MAREAQKRSSGTLWSQRVTQTSLRASPPSWCSEQEEFRRKFHGFSLAVHGVSFVRA